MFSATFLKLALVVATGSLHIPGPLFELADSKRVHSCFLLVIAGYPFYLH